MTAGLSEGRIKALRQLSELLRGTPFVLVGATALECLGLVEWGTTQDLDVTIAMDLDEFPGRIAKLPGWRSLNPDSQSWKTPDGVKVDFIPAGPAILDKGSFTWPISGNRMNLIGFRLAFEHTEPFNIQDDLSVNIASAPVIAVLKMVSYMDRPYERTKDLRDIAHLLENYLADDDPRRWSDHKVFDAGLDFDQTAAYFLGKDIASIVNEAEKAAVREFIDKVQNESDKHQTQARMVMQSPRAWLDGPRDLLHHIEALELGLKTKA